MSTLIGKMVRSVMKGSRGTLSSYSLNAPAQYGQPLPEQLEADAQGLITPARMREVVVKTPTVAACVNAALDYLQGVEIKIRNVDPAQKANPFRVAHVEEYIRRPNQQDTWRRFCLKTFRDMIILGAGAVEIEPDTLGNPANLNVLDAARLKIDFDEHGTVLGYDMLDAHGRPTQGPDGIHAWNPNEIIYFNKNPISNSLYSVSQIKQLYSCAILEDLMLFFISQKFTDSNIPFGVYDLGDISKEALTEAVALWNDQAQNSQHRVLLTGSKSGGKWNVFGYHLKDLEAVQLLAEIRRKIMGVLGVTENELGESQDVNKSNGYNLSFTFKKRTIEPPLDEFVGTLTQRFLWDSLGYTDLEFFYEEIDSRDELLQAQIDDLYLKMGVYCPNDLMNRKGMPNVPGGEVRGMTLGNTFVPLDMLVPMAHAQLQALQAAALGGTGSDGEIKLPLIRGPQPPKGEDNENVRIHYKPNTPQRPRGPVQALRNTGLRKEDAG